MKGMNETDNTKADQDAAFDAWWAANHMQLADIETESWYADPEKA
jgi:hypothetical protein